MYLWNRLQNTNKPIVLYGMGNGADRLLDRLSAFGIPVAGIFASDDFARGHSFRGFPVTTYAEAKEKFGDMIVLLAFGTNLPEVMARIRRIASEQELYAPDMPVYGDSFFTPEFAGEHKAELEKVRSMLADEQSVHVFDNIIRYKLTGELSLLTECETTPDEAFANILKLGKSERYLDLGAYNGDTVRDFAARVGTYERILAVEPDSKTFRKLSACVEALPDCEAINAAVSDRSGTLFFDRKASRGSGVRKEGTVPVRAVTVDELLKGAKITYLNMDVEGQERETISGSKSLLQTHHPKMLISAYHRSEDIFSIPLQVSQFVTDYRIFLRHYPCFPAWDTSFFFV